MIRTLLFFIAVYFLVKIISRLFLKSNQKQNRGGASTFYRTYQHFTQQNQRQNQNRRNSGRTNNGAQQFEEIEEAEFEEITDDEETTSKSSD